jgi:hypothetical protein
MRSASEGSAASFVLISANLSFETFVASFLKSIACVIEFLPFSSR